MSNPRVAEVASAITSLLAAQESLARAQSRSQGQDTRRALDEAWDATDKALGHAVDALADTVRNTT